MKKACKKIIDMISSAIFVVLVIIIIIFACYILRVKYLEKNNRLNEVPINFYTILTQSMYPKIKAGDIIITYKNPGDYYEYGDIITFISTNNYTKGVTITHRVTEILNLNGQYFYKTKGDANNTEDSGSTPASNVIGKVILKIPKAGFIQQFLVSQFGWIVVIVLPCLGVIIYDIIKILKLILGMNKKKTKEITKDDNHLEEKKRLEEVIKNYEE